jgi:predicted DNA-binding protein (UPF0251 family)
MIYLILVLIVVVLAVLLIVKWTTPEKPVQVTTGTLEEEIAMKTKELEILRKKDELTSQLDEVNKQIATHKSPTESTPTKKDS